MSLLSVMLKVEGEFSKENIEKLVKPHSFEVTGDAILIDPDKKLYTCILKGPKEKYDGLDNDVKKVEGYKLFSDPKIGTFD